MQSVQQQVQQLVVQLLHPHQHQHKQIISATRMGSIMFSLLHLHTVCNRVRYNKKYRVSKLAKAKRIREYNKWTK